MVLSGTAVGNSEPFRLRAPQSNHKARPRISMLTRGAVSRPHDGSSKATCGTQCARYASLSLVLKTRASPRAMFGYQCQRCAGSCDALEIAKGPIATINIPIRMRFGLHGNWVDAKDIGLAA